MKTSSERFGMRVGETTLFHTPCMNCLLPLPTHNESEEGSTQICYFFVISNPPALGKPFRHLNNITELLDA
jgi:hypothetical protein